MGGDLRNGSRNKDMAAFLRKLKKQGFDVAFDGKGHWSVRKDGVFVAAAPATAHGPRALGNFKAKFARNAKALGLEWEE